MAAAYALAPTEISLTEWDPTTMNPNSVSLLVGARHSGKSVLLTDIMWHMRKKLDLVVGMSPTESANKTFRQFTPPCFTYGEYSSDAVRNIITWQKNMKGADEAAGEAAAERGEPHTTRMLRAGLLLDDCGSRGSKETRADGKSGKQAIKSDELNEILLLGRHWFMFLAVLVQYMKDAPPSMRANADYVFAFDTNVAKDRVKLYEDFFSINGIPNFHVFQAVFSGAVGVKHSCIVLDVRASRGGGPFAGLHYYLAANRTRDSGHPRFCVGRSVFWRLSDYFFSAARAAIVLDPEKLRPDVYAPPPPPPRPPPDPPAAGGHKGIVVHRAPPAGAQPVSARPVGAPPAGGPPAGGPLFGAPPTGAALKAQMLAPPPKGMPVAPLPRLYADARRAATSSHRAPPARAPARAPTHGHTHRPSARTPPAA